MKNINATLTISRPSNSDDTEVIRIRVRDADASITVMEMEMGLSEMMLALTGQAYIPAINCKVADSSHLGKVKVIERRSISGPKTYSRADLEGYIKATYKEEGWFVDPSLGSQGSVGYTESCSILNFHVFKYVDKA